MDRIPTVPKHDCQAQRSLDTVAANLETVDSEVQRLRYELRQSEIRHAEDVRKLWVRIAVLSCAIFALGGGTDVLLNLLAVII